MKSHRESSRIRASRILCGVLAIAALGASPPEPWETARRTLPPVAVAPIFPVPPAAPVPMQMPPRIDRAIVPASNPAPMMMPAQPVAPNAIPAPARLAPQPVPAVPNIALPNARVYVINGVDPFGWGGLSEMADRIRESGYPDTKFGAWYQVLKFDREIRAAYRQDPNTPVVIIGYSFGVYRAKALASRLSRDGIPVAMVGYIGGDYLRNTPSNVPAGMRVVNVTGDGYLLTGRNMFFNGTELTGADNVRMPGVRHFSLPKQEQTLNALVNGINSATGSGWSMPAVATSPSGIPGSIAAGSEVFPQPRSTSSTYSPISTTGRR